MGRAEAGLLPGLLGGREPLKSKCANRGGLWGEVTLEVWLPFCAKPCAKCRELRGVSDFVSAPRSPQLGVGRPKKQII